MARKKKFSFAIFIITSLAIAGFIYTFIINDSETQESKEPQLEDLKIQEGEAWPPGLDENGGDIKLEDNLLKKNYYIIFDGSGSMEDDNKINIAKQALTEFVKYVPESANLGLTVFDEYGLSERVPLGGSREDFITQVNETSAMGYTPLKESLEIAYSKITEQAQKQLGYGEYNIVVVTDGEASEGSEPDKIVNLILAESPVVIHTIGFQIGEDHSLNQPGRIYYKSAKNLYELSQGLEEVLAESEDFIITDF